MKYFTFFVSVTVLMISCTHLVKNKSEKDLSDSLTSIHLNITRQSANSNLIVNNKKDLLGFWVGMFEPDIPPVNRPEISVGMRTAYDYVNKITVSIDSLGTDSVYGHTIVAGNFRPFRGTYTSSTIEYSFKTYEPGNDQYDGTFNFKISKGDSQISGNWNAYKKLEISKRKYTLQKKVFRYNPNQKVSNVYIDWEKKKPAKNYSEYIPTEEAPSNTPSSYEINASEKRLSKEDLENLSKGDLYIIRNAIYARHGYSFKKRQLRTFFDNQDWYMPVHVDIKKDLTDIEKKNIQLLLTYEKHAEEYYDTFGRG